MTRVLTDLQRPRRPVEPQPNPGGVRRECPGGTRVAPAAELRSRSPAALRCVPSGRSLVCRPARAEPAETAIQQTASRVLPFDPSGRRSSVTHRGPGPRPQHSVTEIPLLASDPTCEALAYASACSAIVGALQEGPPPAGRRVHRQSSSHLPPMPREKLRFARPCLSL